MSKAQRERSNVSAGTETDSEAVNVPLALLQREWGSKGRRESLTFKVPSLVLVGEVCDEVRIHVNCCPPRMHSSLRVWWTRCYRYKACGEEDVQCSLVLKLFLTPLIHVAAQQTEAATGIGAACSLWKYQPCSPFVEHWGGQSHSLLRCRCVLAGS